MATNKHLIDQALGAGIEYVAVLVVGERGVPGRSVRLKEGLLPQNRVDRCRIREALAGLIAGRRRNNRAEPSQNPLLAHRRRP